MVSVQIYGTDEYLEVLDVSITYVKTAGDLGSITTVNSSYSWTFKVPKSPNNTIVLDGLGLVGSGSRKPYEKIYVNVLDNGFPIVIKGLLNIRETRDSYNVFVQEGFIDFLKSINNDTLGEGLDLSELNHERNYSTILTSFALNLPYAYLISDVNGAYFANVSDTTNLDPQYMAPFANVGYLFNLIFETYGWTYTASQPVIDSIDGTWMSYPSEIVLNPDSGIQVAEITSNGTMGDYYKGGVGTNFIYKIPLSNKTLDPIFFEPLNTSDKDYTAKVTGDYLFTFSSNGRVSFVDPWGTETIRPYASVIIVNGTVARNIRDSGSSDGTVISYQLSLNAGDIVSLGASFRPLDGNYDVSVIVNAASVVIDNIGTGGEVSFTQALIKLKISDFIKEVMTRESLTAFVDSENNEIQFMTLEERVSSDFVNWTGKYVKRSKEGYLYRDYAQQNFLRHKYAEEIDEYNDGSLTIDNANLETEKTIYESLSFSPDNELSTFTDNGTDYKIPRLPMFEVEVKEDETTGDLIGTYKFLKGRFFFVKAQPVDNSIYIDGNLINGYPMVNINGNVFKDIVFEKYGTFINLSQDAKVHDIEVVLSLSDILYLDLKKMYYFEEEASYYILNRLTYKTGQNSKAEFLRVQPKQQLRAFSNAFSGAFNI